MKSVIVVALLLAAATADAARPRWNQLDGYTFERYQKDFHKESNSPERRELFEAELRTVRAFNAEGHHTYRKGINHMSDWTAAEKKSLRGRKGAFSSATEKLAAPVSKKVTHPHSIDYRTANPPILTAIKDQGQCGSCWAHAAIEELESMYARKTGELFVLSQQQLVACVANVNECGGTGGCAGGTAETAFEYAIANGVTEEWMYGYSSYFGDVSKCTFSPNKTKVFVTPTSYAVNPNRNDMDSVMTYLNEIGPMAISVDASTWSNYESGIFSGCGFGANITMDHAVQLVGYGSDASLGHDYWIVRNSWSSTFGEAGYIRLIKESLPSCAWDNQWVTQGGGCKGGNNTVWACGQCGILYDVTYPIF